MEGQEQLLGSPTYNFSPSLALPISGFRDYWVKGVARPEQTLQHFSLRAFLSILHLTFTAVPTTGCAVTHVAWHLGSKDCWQG